TENPSIAQSFIEEAERCLKLLEKIKSYNTYQSTKSIIILANELIERYNSFKKIHAKMDYNDMILLTKKLLENKNTAKWVLYKLDGGIDNILIDEAQDTSPDQWSIISSVCDDFFSGLGSSENTRTVFAVGDRKQSIYSFQGADPDKFDEMCKHFSSLSSNFEKVNLDVSFRSTSAVIDTVNRLFSDEQIKKGVASPGEDIEHIPFRKGEGGKVEFWEIIEPTEEKDEDEWTLPTKRTTEISTSTQMAKMIAEKMKKMVSSKEILKSKNRPLQYGDFLILVRSRDNFCEELIRECKALNINISGIDRINLMEQIAVQDLVSLGKFLLLPDDDLSLAEVLKSPLYGLNDNDLFKLCYKRQGTLWNSLLNMPEYQKIAEDLKELFNMADYARPFELYNHVMSKKGGRKKYYERMGKEAEDGIDEFINLSLSFEQSHIASLQNFINWISSDDIEIKREMEQSKNDMVRMMTVHGSKGLQAPIVILPDTTRVPKSNREAGFLWDDNYFLHPNCSDDYDALCNTIKNKQTEKMLEEYRRLLYVAVTRAEDMMIFCGFRKKTKSPDNSWYNMFQKNFTKFADCHETTWSYESPQELVVEKNTSNEQTTANYNVPDFMFVPAAKEKPLSKPLTPSKLEETEPAPISPLSAVDNSVFYKRGTIIHKLLQFIPDIPQEQRTESIVKFIKSKVPEFSEQEQQKIHQEITALIENKEFGIVFSTNSQAEVPIMGEVDGKIISGQIDRLIISDEKVIIVDYKTNRQVPQTVNDVPPAYISQLAAYKSLLKKIYPQKDIETFLLWTNSAYMMKIS
ncbi:MAG: double-strand break repair helicase AddA, partial [Alphaproteobacteria bacterium]|nr:double-strand break repair helicase AddA [Alphaproteobacteria bacterium]